MIKRCFLITDAIREGCNDDSLNFDFVESEMLSPRIPVGQSPETEMTKH